MGIFKGTKTAVVKTDAENALKAGQSVFVCVFNSGATTGHFSGVFGHAGEMIEAVEGVGWKLDTFSAADDRTIIGLFRRA